MSQVSYQDPIQSASGKIFGKKSNISQRKLFGIYESTYCYQNKPDHWRSIARRWELPRSMPNCFSKTRTLPPKPRHTICLSSAVPTTPIPPPTNSSNPISATSRCSHPSSIPASPPTPNPSPLRYSPAMPVTPPPMSSTAKPSSPNSPRKTSSPP